MFEKELVIAQRDENKCFYLNWGIRNSIEYNFDMIAINDLAFIYSKGKEDVLLDFKKQLVDAEISQFVLTEHSSGLMEIIYALNTVGIEIVKPYALIHEESDFRGGKELIQVKGLLMSVNK